jgi:flagellar biogenesis protein FliO
MSEELLQAVKVGERVTVHGVKPRNVDLLVAASVTAANGTLIVDHETRPRA